MGDLGSIPGSGRSPGEGNEYLLQYSGLENSVDCRILFPMSWATLNLCRSLEDGHSEGCELISRSFDLSHFSNSGAEHLFMSFIAIWMPS